MGNIEKKIGELHDLVVTKLTFHDLSSVMDLVTNIRTKLDEITTLVDAERHEGAGTPSDTPTEPEE